MGDVSLLTRKPSIFAISDVNPKARAFISNFQSNIKFTRIEGIKPHELLKGSDF